MYNNETHRLRSIKTNPLFFLLILTWSAGIVASLLFNVTKLKHGSIELARIQARAFFNKDIIYRQWNAMHGGVYVPVTGKTSPNTYLMVTDRDIVTKSGKILTMINPAYMTRQIHEIAAKEDGVKGHITSLDPIRPDNKADAWEIKALQSFRSGVGEVSAIENINGIQYLRLMKPLMTEEECMKCHAAQGYKLGDIRGGISISVPLLPFTTVIQSNRISLFIGHFLLWLFGLCGLTFSYNRLQHQIRDGYKLAQKVLTESQEKYKFFAENMADIVFTIDMQLKFTYVSPSVEKVLGFSHEALKQQPLGNVFTPNSLTHVTALLSGEFEYDKDLNMNPDRSVVIETENYRRDGSTVWLENIVKVLRNEDGHMIGLYGASRNISERKRTIEAEKRAKTLLVSEKKKLQEALAEVKQLSGLLPICSTCKKIRDDKGYWSRIESYIETHSEAEFSHGMCPDCSDKLYGEEEWYIRMKNDEEKKN